MNARLRSPDSPPMEAAHVPNPASNETQNLDTVQRARERVIGLVKKAGLDDKEVELIDNPPNQENPLPGDSPLADRARYGVKVEMANSEAASFFPKGWINAKDEKALGDEKVWADLEKMLQAHADSHPAQVKRKLV